MSQLSKSAQFYKEHIYDNKKRCMKKEYQQLLNHIIKSNQKEFPVEELKKLVPNNKNFEETMNKLELCNFIEYNSHKNKYIYKYMTEFEKKNLARLEDAYLDSLIIYNKKYHNESNKIC